MNSLKMFSSVLSVIFLHCWLCTLRKFQSQVLHICLVYSLEWFLYTVRDGYRGFKVVFFCKWLSSFPIVVYWKDWTFYIVCCHCQGLLATDVWIHIRNTYSLPLVCVSAFMPVPCCFDCSSCVLCLKVWCCNVSNFVLFDEGCIGYSESSMFSFEFLDFFK